VGSWARGAQAGSYLLAVSRMEQHQAAFPRNSLNGGFLARLSGQSKLAPSLGPSHGAYRPMYAGLYAY
jgi:hypothetical protein